MRGRPLLIEAVEDGEGEDDGKGEDDAECERPTHPRRHRAPVHHLPSPARPPLSASHRSREGKGRTSTEELPRLDADVEGTSIWELDSAPVRAKKEVSQAHPKRKGELGRVALLGGNEVKCWLVEEAGRGLGGELRLTTRVLLKAADGRAEFWPPTFPANAARSFPL